MVTHGVYTTVDKEMDMFRNWESLDSVVKHADKENINRTEF